MKICYTKNYFLIYFLIVILFKNSKADVCETCVCSTAEDTTISINCHKAKFVTISVLHFDLISVEYNGTLSAIDLSENNLTYLPTNMFESSRHLKDINLSNNLLEEMHGNVFKYLDRLEILNLSNNKLKTIDIITLPSLHVMDLSHNYIKDLDLEFHKAYSELTNLNLANNELNDSINGSLTLLRKLKHLDLSYNNFNLLDYENFNILSELISLNLSHNKIESLSKQIFPNSLLELNVGFNLLTEFSINLSKVQILNIEYNQIDDIENIKNLHELKYLNVSGNTLKNLSDLKLAKLKVLDLSYNNFTTMPKSLNKDNYPVLETLIFNGNFLTKIEFPSFLNLKSLIMRQMNYIEQIDESSFKKINYLENDCFNLTLTDNSKLNFIEENALSGLNLCFLDLKNNQFTSLDSKLFNSGLKTKFGVDLEGNPFHCNCSLQWMLDKFIPWLYSKNPDLLNNLRCVTPEYLQGKRMVHWYKWKDQVWCDNTQQYSSRMTAETLEVLSRSNSITLHTSSGMLVVLVIAVIALLVLVIGGILFAKKVALKRTRVNRRF